MGQEPASPCTTRSSADKTPDIVKCRGSDDSDPVRSAAWAQSPLSGLKIMDPWTTSRCSRAAELWRDPTSAIPIPRSCGTWTGGVNGGVHCTDVTKRPHHARGHPHAGARSHLRYPDVDAPETSPPSEAYGYGRKNGLLASHPDRRYPSATAAVTRPGLLREGHGESPGRHRRLRS